MIVLLIVLAFLIFGIGAYGNGYASSEAISSERAEYTVWGSE